MALLKRLLSPAVFLYQCLAIVILLAAASYAAQWSRQPFLGALIDQSLTVRMAAPSRPGRWALREIISSPGYQIKSINGIEAATSQHLNSILSDYAAGQPASLVIESPQGTRLAQEIVLQRFPLPDRITYIYIPYLIALLFLLSGLWVFNMRRRSDVGKLYAVFTASVCIALVTFFEVNTTHHLTYLWFFSLAVAGGAMFSLSTVFPQEVAVLERRPYLRWIGLLPSIVLPLANLPFPGNLTSPYFSWLIYAFLGLSILLFLGLSAYWAVVSTLPISQEQGKQLFSTAAVSFGPLTGWFSINTLWPEAAFTPYLLIPLFFFPIGAAYLILHSQAFTTNFMVRRGVTYVILAALTMTGYALLVSGTALIFERASIINSPYLLGITVFLIALVFNPLRARVQAAVDAHFARGQTQYRELQELFNKELTKASGLPAIVSLVRRVVAQTLRPSHFHLFTYDSLTGFYSAAMDESEQPSTDIRFSAGSALVEALASQRSSVLFGVPTTLPAAYHAEQSRIALMGSQLFVPLPGRERLIGWLALGQRSSGGAYTDQDLSFLEALCDQSALAIERAQVIENLERRMHEMNVLTRVSQGINVTLAFDDILELIYAQTYQVIPTLDFRITLQDQFSSYLYHVFYLEKDERINEKENVPLPLGQGLELEVVQSRRPLLTDDYERECRSRGVMPACKGLFAWMGVPLNAGAETIGLISLASPDPGKIYTNEQINLLQAIADQAAGAIVKARLLQESQRRARQLTFLNEVARNLTSTLELDRLLNQILQNAVEILNCEAGSLLLTDPQTDELVFQVVVGPAAEDLIGVRMPAGVGLAGTAVSSQAPIVSNDVRRTKEWLDLPDQQSGLVTRDVLVVPMIMKDKVIGVLEVINRKDGLPFTPDDQELLTAFTSQAAVAIENARLYTLTDQALAARVEELSVMQRIDRELNASLDVGRAMRITLSWAVRQSGAEAGFVGAVEESGIRLMASSGYADEQKAFDSSILTVTIPAIEQAVSSGQPCHLSSAEQPQQGLLPATASQVALPIRREENVIGVLFLESTQAHTLAPETLAFLSRLVDHAAIAIANAQLYAAIEAANLAKSKFVSFVAHELKNPMASIKGYTELVAGGMAGPVNEMQSSFLATVTSNVDRMNTIVSDLNDLTKIEMGSLRLEFKPTQLKDGFDEVIRSLRRPIEDKSLTIQLDLPDPLPAVWTDPNRINQILINLMSNAVKYTPTEGRVTISVEKCQNPIVSSTLSEVLHIRISDTGIGIAPEDQDKIFQQYFRTNISKDFASGTGLGLHITKTLVEMQGGVIWFDSEINKGTTFHFTVPIVEAG